MRIGNQKKKQHWVRHIDNVDIDLLLYWSLSKYFYYEIGPILRTIMVPMFILLSLAIPYLIFDVVTDFYHPRFLESLLLFLDTNIFMKIIVFILYFDLAVVVLLFIISLLRKDFSKRLHQYGIQSLHEIIISKTRSFAEHAEAVVKGENPYHQKANLYVTGHTHSAELKEFKDNNFIFADTGSWKQLMKRMPAYLNFPSVFFPYYSLTYLTCTNTKDGIDIQLRAWPKDFMPSLSLLERFAIKRKKHVPKPYLVDTLIKGIHID